jgi:hypothetical protein
LLLILLQFFLWQRCVIISQYKIWFAYGLSVSYGVTCCCCCYSPAVTHACSKLPKIKRFSTQEMPRKENLAWKRLKMVIQFIFICSLFLDALSVTETFCVERLCGKWQTNWKRFGRARWCRVLRYYPGIRLEGLRKITKNLSLDNRLPGWDLVPEPHEFTQLKVQLIVFTFETFFLTAHWVCRCIASPAWVARFGIGVQHTDELRLCTCTIVYSALSCT